MKAPTRNQARLGQAGQSTARPGSAPGINRKTFRWQSVTGRWRKLVESETSHVIGVEKSVGFIVMDARQKVDNANLNMRKSVKASKRSLTVLSLTDRKQLDENDQKRYDQLRSRAGRLLQAANMRRNSPALPDDNILPGM